MPVPKPNSQTDNTKTSNSLFVIFIPAITFVFLILLMAYIGERFNALDKTLEDKMHFQPPVVENARDSGGYAIEIVDGQTVYVPVYSHIYSEGGQAYLLETTLSIRNSDPNRPITIQSVRYYDTKGQLVEDHIKGSVSLGPLETISFLVEKSDVRGGSGANFIVAWDAVEPVYEPIIEAIMVGAAGVRGISFVSHGRTLSQRQE